MFFQTFLQFSNFSTFLKRVFLLRWGVAPIRMLASHGNSWLIGNIFTGRSKNSSSIDNGGYGLRRRTFTAWGMCVLRAEACAQHWHLHQMPPVSTATCAGVLEAFAADLLAPLAAAEKGLFWTTFPGCFIHHTCLFTQADLASRGCNFMEFVFPLFRGPILLSLSCADMSGLQELKVTKTVIHLWHIWKVQSSKIGVTQNWCVSSKLHNYIQVPLHFKTHLCLTVLPSMTIWVIWLPVGLDWLEAHLCLYSSGLNRRDLSWLVWV